MDTMENGIERSRERPESWGIRRRLPEIFPGIGAAAAMAALEGDFVSRRSTADGAPSQPSVPKLETAPPPGETTV